MSNPIIKDGEKEKKKKRILKADSSPSVIETKKSKTADSVPTREFHIAQFHAEEEEAASRNPDKDLDIFKTACGNIRQAIVDIKQLKSKQDTDSEIENKRIDASLQFVVLKKLNRLSHFRCRKMREATSEAKQRIDQYHLQLQNLLYEAMHLQKEITKCLEFKSKDEEIELIDVEEFYKEAPVDISRPKLTKNDPHQLTLARLDWELEQRKQLATKLKESQSSKETISQEITTKEEYLESLQPKLSSILQATKPVQNYLGMPYDEIREQHQTAYHLPHPLYVLYMQSSAFQEACDKHLKVTIEGDVDAAKSSNSSAAPEIDEESDSDQEEQEAKKSKRRRKTVEARQSDKKEKVLRKHPLSVVLDITCKDGSCLRLTFNYLVLLQIITVSVKVIPSGDAITSSISGGDLLSAESILNELYPGDHGNTSPNQANHFELKRLGMDEFTHYISRVGRPYMWAQWLGGLQFLSDGPSDKARSSVSASHMQETIKQLRRRIRARLSLLKQLASLERCSIPVSSDCIKLFPAKIIAQVTSWKRTTYEDFACLAHAQGVIKDSLVKETDMFFTVTMDRGSARLTAQVVVTPD
ncbi:THO complex subunit 5 homolog A-like isoform X2 [Gigantopelta aegis]|nr:THO complex subunit 5 homolog A-like isoform X2 [Gigantopelta aegis]